MNKSSRVIKGIKVNHAKPCTVCGSDMVCHDTAAISGENRARTHYLLACSVCGYGPAQAFSTTKEAIDHWNTYVNQTAQA